jgi:competence protein ComEA
METKDFLQWWEKRGRFGLIGMAVGLIILGAAWLIVDFQEQTSDVQFYSVQEDSKEDLAVMIDVRGAVKKPGVYELDNGSRLGEAVTVAGGYSDEADIDWVDLNLNMARELSDGEKILIPRKNEDDHLRGVSTNDSSNGVIGKSQMFVNLNTASQSELETLPGIGPSFAQRIIDYRQDNGGFRSIEEVQAVSGIGEKTFQKIKGQISI